MISLAGHVLPNWLAASPAVITMTVLITFIADWYA